MIPIFYLKHSLKDAEQVFILTHNFNFLKLVLDWFKYEKSNSRSCYVIKNQLQNADKGKRKAYINALNKKLTENISEYHYLFRLLRDFSEDSESSEIDEDAYYIPNLARKFLEIFLDLALPLGGKTLHYRIRNETLVFDDDKKDMIYKFVSEQSHSDGNGFDPALVPAAKEAVKHLLELVRTTQPKHYEFLEESTEE